MLLDFLAEGEGFEPPMHSVECVSCRFCNVYKAVNVGESYRPSTKWLLRCAAWTGRKWPGRLRTAREDGMTVELQLRRFHQQQRLLKIAAEFCLPTDNYGYHRPEADVIGLRFFSADGTPIFENTYPVDYLEVRSDEQIATEISRAVSRKRAAYFESLGH
jgi:hypothetical protein